MFCGFQGRSEYRPRSLPTGNKVALFLFFLSQWYYLITRHVPVFHVSNKGNGELFQVMYLQMN
jgi:hypothetical protein